jgi:hypothetical protein
VSTRRSASIVRASSPPLATRASGSSGEPGFAANRNDTSSPGSCSPTVTATVACGMANSRRWCCTSSARAPAPARRARPTDAAAVRSPAAAACRSRSRSATRPS